MEGRYMTGKQRWSLVGLIAVGVIVLGVGLVLFVRMLMAGGEARRNAIGTLVIPMCVLVFSALRHGLHRRKTNRSVSGFYLFWLAGSFVVICGIVGLTQKSIEQGSAQIRNAPTTLIGLFVVCAVAFGLYWVRRKARSIYGTTELLFAIGLAWHLLPSNPVAEIDLSDIQFVGLMTGCVYLMVRGMDNIEQGWPTDVVLKWMRQKSDSQDAAHLTNT
jgi:asparagine N-glycosylation enzyme membrane subunit Stt3